MSPKPLSNDFRRTLHQTQLVKGSTKRGRRYSKNTLCRALFGGTNPLTLLSTYASNGLISAGTTYPVAQSGGGIRQKNFSSGDVGAVTSYAAGSYPSPTAPGVRISANPITINQNGFYFSGNNTAGVAVNTLQGAGVSRPESWADSWSSNNSRVTIRGVETR